MIGISLVVYVFMRDTKADSAINRHEWALVDRPHARSQGGLSASSCVCARLRGATAKPIGGFNRLRARLCPGWASLNPSCVTSLGLNVLFAARHVERLREG
jgi:hypothetical protein